MKEYRFLIPANNIEQHEYQAELEKMFLDFTGGYTCCNVWGVWRDASGEVHSDTCIEYRLAVDSEQEFQLRESLRKVCCELGEQCLYFAHPDNSIEFLKPYPIYER